MTMRLCWSSLALVLLTVPGGADGEHDWQRLLAALREKGLPVSQRDVDVRLDAVPLLQRVSQWLRAPPAEAVTAVKYLLTELPAEPERRELLAHREYVEALSPAYELVAEALQQPRCDFGAWAEQDTSPFMMLSVETPLRFRLLVAAPDGNSAQAAALLGDIGELGRRMPGFGRNAACIDVARLVRHIVSVSIEPRETLRNVLEPVLQRAPRVNTALAAIDMDIGYTIDVVERWSKGESVDAEKAMNFARDTGWSADMRPDAEMVGKVRADVLRYVAGAERLREMIETDPEKALNGRGGALMRVVRGHLSTAVWGQTELNLARVGLAVAVYHERHGSWPESLAALAEMFPGGRVPCDAGGGDFRYAGLGDAAEVASRGGKWLGESPPSWRIRGVAR